MKRKPAYFLTAWLCIAVLVSGVGMGACGNAAEESSGEAVPAASAVSSEEEDAAPSDESSSEQGEFLYEEAEDGTVILTGYTGSEEEPVIPAEIGGMPVKEIGDGCFRGLLCLRKVTVPEGIERIGDYSFECCSALEKIYFPASLKEIGEGAFSGCANLFLADMQDGIEKIGKGAFLYCSSLVYLELSGNLSEIGRFAFAECSSLVKVRFRGNSVGELPDRAFYGCRSVSQIRISDSLKRIGKRAFSGCGSLISIYFPGGLSEIGEYAFEDCTSLNSVDGIMTDSYPENIYEGCLQMFPLEEGQDIGEEEGEVFSGENPELPAEDIIESGETEETEEKLVGETSSDQQEDKPSETAPDFTASSEPEEAGSIAGKESLFDEEAYSDYLEISNDDYAAWSEKYLEYNRNLGILFSHELMPYITLYKGEVIPYYIGMTAVQNRDPEMWETAEAIFGDDFEEMFLMMDHGLSVELSRGRMCDDLVLYSGVYDSQLMAAAGTKEVPSLEQLKDAVGTVFTDPVMISTSTDIQIACGFSDTLFIIYASKEKMDALGAVSIDSCFGSVEKEVLMDAGASYKVLDVGTIEIPTTDYEGQETVIYRNYIRVELM